MHRQVIDGISGLTSLRVSTLLLMIDGIAVNDEYSSLSVVVLICFGDLELLVHEGEL